MLTTVVFCSSRLDILPLTLLVFLLFQAQKFDADAAFAI
jgi:hypothetical protein